MPYDLKYGRVTLENQRNIDDDEPVFVFRAKDKLTGPVLSAYFYLCEAAGSPDHHLDGITDAAQEIADWQETHTTQTPQSESLKENTQ